MYVWYVLLHTCVWQPDVDGRSISESLFTLFTEAESLNCAQSSQIWKVWLTSCFRNFLSQPSEHWNSMQLNLSGTYVGFEGNPTLVFMLWTIPQHWSSLCEMVSYCAHSRDTAGPQEKFGTSGETKRQAEASHVLPLYMQVTSLCRPASSALQPTRHNAASQVLRGPVSLSQSSWDSDSNGFSTNQCFFIDPAKL